MLMLGAVAIVMMVPVVVMDIAIRMIVTVIVNVVVMLVGVVMQSPERPRSARILFEDQRLDGDRHGPGREPDPSEIDEVEVPQRHSVDDENLALD